MHRNSATYLRRIEKSKSRFRSQRCDVLREPEKDFYYAASYGVLSNVGVLTLAEVQ